jgi:hypothetical protein
VPARTRLAQLIGREEGFGRPGTIPTLRNNPGDLRHSPHASHDGIDPNAIGIEPSEDAGWDDLERQLDLYAARGMTLAQMVAIYAPPTENETNNYLKFLCDTLGVSSETLVSAALTVPAATT